MMLHARIDFGIFLIEKGADVKTKGNHGWTALHFAETLEVAKILVEHGADIEAVLYDGDTPLIRQSEHGNVDIVKYLLSVGANKKAKNKGGQTAFDVACNRYPADQSNKAELQKILK